MSELNSTALADVLRDLDYLIDDVVAEAYVRGVEGRDTETSPQSAKTLHDAIAAALVVFPLDPKKVEGLVKAVEAYQTAVERLGESEPGSKVNYFEELPLSIEGIKRWRSLNDTGKALTEAARAIRPTQGEAGE